MEFASLLGLCLELNDEISLFALTTLSFIVTLLLTVELSTPLSIVLIELLLQSSLNRLDLLPTLA